MQMGSLCNEMALKGKYLDERVSSSPEEKAVILEKNLFRTVCPNMIRSAVELLDEMMLPFS